VEIISGSEVADEM